MLGARLSGELGFFGLAVISQVHIENRLSSLEVQHMSKVSLS